MRLGLCIYSDFLIISLGQVYDAIEVFAGVATLSRCLQYANFETAALDVEHWDPWYQQRLNRRLRKTCNGNPLDLLTPAGFALLDLDLTHMFSIGFLNRSIYIYIYIYILSLTTLLTTSSCILAFFSGCC